MTELPHIESLRGGTTAAIAAADLDLKTALAQETARRWFARTLSMRSPLDPALPARPGRPEKPELIPPKHMEKRSLHTLKGRIALLHALAHIELNAVDLALDIVARFTTERVPHSFFDGWMQVAFEEAKHFRLIRDRLRDLGADYGDLPAHDGLWQAAHDTRNDLTARLAVVPLILEARGLDVTPTLQAKMRETGDDASADILDIIYNDEKGHVAVGAKFSLRPREEGSVGHLQGTGAHEFSRAAEATVQRCGPRRGRADTLLLSRARFRQSKLIFRGHATSGKAFVNPNNV